MLGIYLLRFSIGFYQYDILSYLQHNDPKMLELKFDSEFIVGFFYLQFAFTVLFMMVLGVNKKDWYQFLFFLGWLAFLGSLFTAVFMVVSKKLYTGDIKDFKQLSVKSIELIFAVAITIGSLIEQVFCWKAIRSITTSSNVQRGENRIDVYIEPDDNDVAPEIPERSRVTSYASHDSRAGSIEAISSAPPIIENPQQQQPSLSPQWLEMQDTQINASQLEALYGPPPAYKP